MLLNQIVAHLEQELTPTRFADYCPNGLQVEGRCEVRRIVTGVTASQALLEQAYTRNADAVLVHHGYFWKGEDPCIVGIKKARLHTLLQHEISLLAYHLPLDAHPTLGNNAQLARVLGLTPEGQRGEQNLLWYGTVDAPSGLAGFAQDCAHRLQRIPLVIGEPTRMIRRVAWCTGGAQNFFTQAVSLEVDAFITGEASESCCHMARETGVAFIAAGHHATERYGIQALGEWLQKTTGVACEFVDVDNPI